MKIKAYAVYDNKAEAFMQPFFAGNPGLAIRTLSDNCKNPESIWNRHPNDFCLYEIGEYDENSGELINHETNKNLGMAIEYIKQEIEAVG